MGFFSSILGGIGKVVGFAGRALGILPAKVAKAASPLARAAAVAVPVVTGGLIGAGLAGGGGAAAGTALAAQGGQISVTNPATGQIVGVGGGNGVQTTVTMVQTIENATGRIISAKIFQGSPFLMNKEVAHLKSVSKKLRRGASSIPSRTRQPSTNQLINMAVKDQILHSVQAVVQPAG